MSLDKIYVALDQMNLEEIDALMHRSHHQLKNIKVGLELFLKFGPQVVHDLHNKYKCHIFLDLKLHDIPTTVAKSIQSLKGLPITFLTIHLSGGREMIIEALKARDQYLPNTKLLGVSFLTSLSNENIIETFGIELNDQAYKRLFNLAIETKIDGVVCSPLEQELVKCLSNSILTMTPGVRFKEEIAAQNNLGDQKRIKAIEDILVNGCDYLVVGRSLTQVSEEKLNERLKTISTLKF